MERTVYEQSFQLYRYGALREFSWPEGSSEIRSPVWRLYWNRRGLAIFSTKQGSRCSADSRNFVLIPPDVSFERRVCQRLDHFFVHFELSGALRLPSLDLIAVQASERDLELAARLFHERASASAMGGRTYCEIQSLVFSLLGKVLDGRALPDIEQGVSKRMQEALRHIDLAQSTGDNVAELERQLGLSAKTVYRLFRYIFDCTPSQYLHRQRTQRAAVQLLYSNGTIDQIAEQNGFCDRYYFTRVFTREYGLAPGKFRRRGP